MKTKVNKDVCIGCGACTQIAEEVFDFGDDGLAEVKAEIEKDENGFATVNDENKDSVFDASEGCPVGAIIVEE